MNNEFESESTPGAPATPSELEKLKAYFDEEIANLKTDFETKLASVEAEAAKLSPEYEKVIGNLKADLANLSIKYNNLVAFIKSRMAKFGQDFDEEAVKFVHGQFGLATVGADIHTEVDVLIDKIKGWFSGTAPAPAPVPAPATPAPTAPAA